MAYLPEPLPREESATHRPEEPFLLLTHGTLVANGPHAQLATRLMSIQPEWEQWDEMAPQLRAHRSSLGYFLYHPDQQLTPLTADIPMPAQH